MFISNNMKNAILKNTNINKLSKNEYHVYKNDNTNLLISSFLLETIQLTCITLLIKIYTIN